MKPEIRLFMRRLAHHKTIWRALVSFLRGIVKFLRWYRGWLAAVDKAHLIGEGSTGRDRASHDNWCKLRRIISFVMLGLIGLVVLIAKAMMGIFGPILLSVVLVLGLGAWGRPEDKNVLVEKEALPTRPVINADTVRQIVASATKGMRAEDWKKIRVLGPGVVWDKQRVWWACRIEMPGTIPGSAVARGYEGVMSGLAVGRSQVIIKVHPENEAVVTIMGTEQDPWARPPRQTPMMKIQDATSVFDPIPIGDDKRGQTIFVSIVMTGWLVGAIPRMGKTNLICLLALWCAMDPNCDMAVFDFKGSADWRMFESMCIQFGAGRTPLVFRRLVDYLLSVQQEIERRGEVMASLPHERIPEGELTRELAMDESLDLRPIVIFIDEVHWPLKHPLYGKKITDLIEDIAKTGQYVGVWLVLATQRPDADAIPTRIRDVLGTRSAGKCTTWKSSETILGSSAREEGWDAAKLPRRAGVFIIYGADDSAELVEAQEYRVHRCDIPQRQMVAWRAQAIRDAVGRLPRQCDSLAMEEPILLRRVREVQGDRPYVLTSDLLDHLNSMPEFSDEPWSERTLGSAMRGLEFESKPINRDGHRGKRGYDVRGDDDDR